MIETRGYRDKIDRLKLTLFFRTGVFFIFIKIIREKLRWVLQSYFINRKTNQGALFLVIFVKHFK